MAEKKTNICPLAYAVTKGAYDQEIADFDYCVKERCAWWFASDGRCSILLLAEALDTIARRKSDGR